MAILLVCASYSFAFRWIKGYKVMDSLVSALIFSLLIHIISCQGLPRKSVTTRPVSYFPPLASSEIYDMNDVQEMKRDISEKSRKLDKDIDEVKLDIDKVKLDLIEVEKVISDLKYIISLIPRGSTMVPEKDISTLTDPNHLIYCKFDEAALLTQLATAQQEKATAGQEKADLIQIRNKLTIPRTPSSAGQSIFPSETVSLYPQSAFL
jgi:hypothetical protein